MVMAFALGGIAILLSVLAVGILTASMPRSGGGYVVISRILGPTWGFLGAWLEFLSIALSFGLIAAVVFDGVYNSIGPTVFPGFGPPSGIPTDWVLFLGGLALIIIFTAVGVFGIKLTGLLLQGLFWIPAILTFYVFGLLASGTSSTVSNGLANLFSGTSYAGITPDKYVAAAVSPPGGAFPAISSVLAGGYWDAVGTALIGAYFAYIGYAASTFVAGEVKEANRTLPRTLVAASILIIALFVTMSALGTGLIRGVAVTPDGKFSFFSAWSYLSWGCSTGGSQTCLAAAGLPPLKLWTTTLASLSGRAVGLGPINLLVFLFGILWVVNDIPPFILTASRILFAMSFDRVLPTPLANVNDRFHSPVNAVLVTGIVAVAGCFSQSGLLDVGGSLNPSSKLLETTFGSSSGVVVTDLYDAVFFTLFTLCLIVLPLRGSKRGILDTAPYKPGGKWGMIGLGIAGVAANLFIDYMLIVPSRGDLALSTFLASSTRDYLLDLWLLWFTIILAAIGMVIYYLHKARRGINYSAIFTQIPPE
jgi:amino acid transporter